MTFQVRKREQAGLYERNSQKPAKALLGTLTYEMILNLNSTPQPAKERNLQNCILYLGFSRQLYSNYISVLCMKCPFYLEDGRRNRKQKRIVYSFYMDRSHFLLTIGGKNANSLVKPRHEESEAVKYFLDTVRWAD